MDFFEHQEHARRKSGLLTVNLAVTVMLLVSALYFVCLQPYLAHLQKAGRLDGVPMDARLLWQPRLLAYVGAVVLTTIAAAGLYKIFRLRKGGVAIAGLVGARRIDTATKQIAELTLVNVVEEMSIASGLPVPPVYLLETNAINAFAAGWNPSNAVIVVTRGSLNYLSRDELQAVIAHELSHITHGDTGLNIQLLGLLHGITFIGLTGLALIKTTRFFSFEGEDARKLGCALSMPFLLIGVPLAAVGYAGVLAARITKSAIAREREYLADAAAVQFTRNPDALSSALKKIGGHGAGSKILHPQAEQLSHFFFSEGVRSLILRPSWLRGWFRSHPSLHERIVRVDRDFDGRFHPTTPSNLARGRDILEGIPATLRRAVHDHGESLLLLYALLLPKDAEPHTEALRQFLSRDGVNAVLGFHRELAALSQERRLALVDLSAPALRELDNASRAAVFERFETLAGIDARFDAFELAIYAVMKRRLHKSDVPPLGRRARSAELAVVVSAMARAGRAGRARRTDEARAEAAYQVALPHLPAGVPMPERPLTRDELSRDALTSALELLAGLAPSARRQVLDACIHASLSDRDVNAEEAALIRAVASALELPIPPLAAEKVRS